MAIEGSFFFSHTLTTDLYSKLPSYLQMHFNIILLFTSGFLK